MTLRWITTVLAGIALCFASYLPPLLAAPPDDGQPVSAEVFVAENSPDDGLLAAVYLRMAPGWHIYWQNPGEAGIPVAIRWELPEGFRALPLDYPVPSSFESAGLTGYGYAGEVVLFSRIVPDDGRTDRSFPETAFPLGAELSWLSCGEVCIPGSAELTLDGSPPEPGRRELVRRFLRRVPGKIDGERLALRGAQAAERDGRRFLEIGFSGAEAAALKAFYPLSPKSGLDLKGISVESGSVTVPWTGDTLPESISGVVETERSAYVLDAPIASGGGDGASSEGMQAGTPLFVMLGLAFLGGVLLNVMPCVLPVLGLKVFSLIGPDRSGPDHVKTGRYLSLVFAFGVLLSFWALAVFVWVLQEMGEQVGWGFQFQSPVFLMLIATVVFAFGMNLFGLYEFGSPAVSGKIGRIASHRDALGAFVSGVLATTLATPCTAPFLGTALGFAFAQPPAVIFLFFTVVALGMAAPYVIFAWHPAWLKFLPKPGHWMYLFKQFMGFILVAVVIWLASILGVQAGSGAVTRLLLLLLAVAFVLWIVGTWTGEGASLRKQLLAWGAGLALLAAVFVPLSSGLRTDPGGRGVPLSESAQTERSGGGVTWHEFSPDLLDSLRSEKKTVFLEFTADWCITCKVLEATVLRNDAVLEALRREDVAAVRADWTTKDDRVTAMLQRFGRSGVPLFVVIPEGNIDDAIVLPEIVTVDILLDALEKALRSAAAFLEVTAPG